MRTIIKNIFLIWVESFQNSLIVTVFPPEDTSCQATVDLSSLLRDLLLTLFYISLFTLSISQKRIFSILKESFLKHKNHNILAFQHLSQHFRASRLIGMQKNKRRSTKHQRAQTESRFFLDNVYFFDELSVDSNPKRLRSVRLDKCLLDSLLPCGFCGVSLESLGVAAE